jgi:hypothetical protein
VTWPENLQDHAPRISQDLKGFVDGYKRLRAAIGRDRPLGHHHIPAVLLLAKSRDLDYRDLEVPQSYSAEVVARFLAPTSVHQFNAEDERLLWEVLQATGHLDQNNQVKPWQEFPTGECLLLLVLSDFLEAQGVQNVVLSLSGLGLFSRPVHDLMPLLSQVRVHLKEQTDLWPYLVQHADHACSLDQAERAVGLLSAVCLPERWISLVRDDTPRMIAVALLLGYLDDRLTRSEAVRPLTLSLSHKGRGDLDAEPTDDSGARIELPEHIPQWAEPWMNDWDVPHHDAPAEARASVLLRMLTRIVLIQHRLAAPLPQAEDIGALVDMYTESDDVRLELFLALARKDADVIDNEARLSRLQEFFGSSAK